MARISREDPPRAAAVEQTWAHWHHKRWTCIEYALLASGLDMDAVILPYILAKNPTELPLVAAGTRLNVALQDATVWE
ncbi:hypothetical protein ASPCADRAFT_205502 [Aspergillus carbonarius ITEM 5010]|uniref:Uncharacterized protein n=1 Tax=Aspergillus carbonarius (strain ITEM 5010) TaxID=602072 RepID=A0A1R3RUW0_ASPC5|nr:hypothetical protein ASPCADRAFT_205502 [Aspergillus carbonarius ITEM 5010]